MLLLKNDIRIDYSFVTSAEKSLKLLAESLEPYKKAHSTIMTNANKIMKIYSSYSQIEMNGIVESLQKTMDLYAKINMICSISDQFSDSMRKTIESFVQFFRVNEQISILESAKVIEESMNAISESFALEQLKQLQLTDFSTMFSYVIPKTTSLSDIAEIACFLVQDEMKEESDENDSFEGEEIQEALIEQATNPKGFQARFADWTEKKKYNSLLFGT